MEKAIRGLYEEACRVIGMPCGLFRYERLTRKYFLGNLICQYMGI
jgi:hypothetical protein